MKIKSRQERALEEAFFGSNVAIPEGNIEGVSHYIIRKGVIKVAAPIKAVPSCKWRIVFVPVMAESLSQIMTILYASERSSTGSPREESAPYLAWVEVVAGSSRVHQALAAKIPVQAACWGSAFRSQSHVLGS
jgi:hypothetical protein